MKSLSTNQMALLDGGRCNVSLCWKAFVGYSTATNPVAMMAFYAIFNSRTCNTCEFGEA